jgi:hypothetical protein
MDPRRRHNRFEPLSQLQVAWRSDGEYEVSVISDLCESGAFIHTSEPPEAGTVLHLLLDVPTSAIRAQAVVRRTIPGQGMGVEFEAMSKDDRERFENLLGVTVPLWREEGSKAGHKPKERGADAAPAGQALRAKVPGSEKASDASSLRTPGSERRAHLRHKIAAAVDLVVAGTGELIKGHLADLARMGCYVKADNFYPVGTAVELTMARNSQSLVAQARVVSAAPGKGMGLTFTRLEPEQSVTLDQWLAVSMESSWLSSIRRRSHRVLLKLPVQVSGDSRPGAEFVENTQTISVSADGALLLLSADVAKGQVLILSNLRTNATLECSVVYVGQMQERQREVGVSFTLPNPMFWQVVFPPRGWSPRGPDAKKG